MYVTKNTQEGDKSMLTRNFGIEIEFTGITREKEARTVAEHLEGSIRKEGQNYKVVAPDGRIWQVVYDGS